MTSYIYDTVAANRSLIEGLCFLLAGWGFLTFDFFRHLGEDLTEETLDSYGRGLILAAIAFIVFGLLNIFLDCNFRYGITYIIAAIGLLMYSRNFWSRPSWYYAELSVCLFFVFCGFLGIAISSILDNRLVPQPQISYNAMLFSSLGL